MALRLPRPERKKKKPAKSADMPRSMIKSDYQNSLGVTGPIPYAQLIAAIWIQP